MLRRPLFSLIIAVVLAALPAAGAAARQDGQTFPLGAPVRFEPHEKTLLHLSGHGPYRGVLEFRRSSSGVTVVNELDIESYLLGLREVPGRWPMEALKAQAVAARTYVLWEAERGYWQRFGFDVCATTDCQVYGGAAGERGEEGRRWIQAVRETAGEVLLWNDEPILARYHASSGGRTLPNEAVYPSSGPRPYLVGVDDPADVASPLHRWSVEFSREQLQEILRVGIDLAGEIEDVVADADARRVTIRTKGGSLEMSTVRMRRVLSTYAPRVYPELFPAPRPDGRPMPMTLPSSRFTVEKTDDGFLVSGRGYGHGVGMSQWGAKGRADAGDGYEQILAAYYGGLRPQSYEMPDAIRVGIVRGASEAAVFGDGSFAVRSGGDEIANSTLGSWAVRPGPRGSVHLEAPEGFAAPLVLSGVEVPEEVLHDPPEQGTDLPVSFVVPKAAKVAAELARSGEHITRVDGLFDAGPGLLRIPLQTDRLARRADYTVVVTAFDGEERATRELPVRIVKAGGRPLWPAALASVLTLAALAVALRRRALSGRVEEPAAQAGRVPTSERV